MLYIASTNTNYHPAFPAMNGDTMHHRHSCSLRSNTRTEDNKAKTKEREEALSCLLKTEKMPPLSKAFFMTWSLQDISYVARYHPIPCTFAISLLFFMAVEYTLLMVPSSSPPFDIGFQLTRHLHRLLSDRHALNSVLAGLNTVFVGMQTTYILWTWMVEGRPRAAISALFMFTCRGILGYSTQLPLPQGFLGSGVDFPVGNVSFFLFFSGHVAASVIASLDMRRVGRHHMAWTFDMLNVLQGLRLLATRGHYTIDLAVGVGAGMLFDSLAGKYEESKRKSHPSIIVTDAIPTVQYKR